MHGREAHGLRYIALQRAQPSGKILSTVTRVSWCVKILRRETILTELFLYLPHHHRAARPPVSVPLLTPATLRLAIRLSIRPTAHFVSPCSVHRARYFFFFLSFSSFFFVFSFLFFFFFVYFRYSLFALVRRTPASKKCPTYRNFRQRPPHRSIFQRHTAGGSNIVRLNCGIKPRQKLLRSIAVSFCQPVRPFNNLRNVSRWLLRIGRLSRMP